MIIFITFCLFIWLFIRFARRHDRAVAFFHPYCDAGGGGEKVLWEAISAIRQRWPDYCVYVFTGDSAAEAEILFRAESRFNLKIDSKVKLVKLKWRWLVEAETWPYFTLAGQSAGSIMLALEAVVKVNAEVVIDSMGYSFTYPLFRLCGAKVASYIHYPTISCDMLKKVESRKDDFNNRQIIAKYAVLTRLKLIYYRLFTRVYKFCGRRSQAIMTNSSWTKNHIDALWSIDSAKIFPPCDVTKFTALPLEPRDSNLLISLAQFRPEKNHLDQVRAFKVLKQSMPDREFSFVIAGGVRNRGDEDRADEVERLAAELGLSDAIQVERNISSERMQHLFRNAHAAIHTMKDEHFGITCVEFKASGIITVAHNSAGPGSDILVPFENAPTGFLANNLDEFATHLVTIFSMGQSERRAMAANGQRSCHIFTSEQFRRQFCSTIESLFL